MWINKKQVQDLEEKIRRVESYEKTTRNLTEIYGSDYHRLALCLQYHAETLDKLFKSVTLLQQKVESLEQQISIVKLAATMESLKERIDVLEVKKE